MKTVTRRTKDIAELIGIIAIVASLIFVGLQMQQTQEIASAEVLSSNVGHRIEANNGIAANAEIWSKANLGQELTAAETALVDRLTDSFVAARVSVWLHFHALGYYDDAELQLTDLASFLSRHPGIYARWADREKRLVEDRARLNGPEQSLAGWLEGMRQRVEKLQDRQGTTQTLPDPLQAGWSGVAVCERLLEDPLQRVLRCNFPPGAGQERHFHAPHIGYAIAGGRVRIVDDSGTRDLELATGSSYSSNGVAWHDVMNIGDTTITYLIVEKK